MAEVETGGTVSVEHTTESGHIFNVESNSGTKAEITQSLQTDETKAKAKQEKADAKSKVSEAASELGKKGGKAAARARAESQKQAKTKESEDAHDETVREGEETEPAKTRGAEEGKGGREDSAPEESGEEVEKRSPRHDSRLRVEEVTREHAETKRQLKARAQENEDLRRRLAEVERRTATPEERKAQERDETKEPEPPGKPKAEDFDDFEKYLEARDDWRDRIRETRETVRAQHRQRTDRVNGIVSTFQEKVKEFADSDPSFYESIAPEIEDLQPTLTLKDDEYPSGPNFIADELLMSPSDAPALMKYLSENPDEFQRIAALRTPREVTREMARLPIDAATTGESSAREVEVSKAPPPIKPVSGKPHVGEGELYREGMDLDQFAQGWNRKVKPTLLRR